MKFQQIRTAYQCEVQLLSPVHIGCGESYMKDFDFFCEGSRVKVFDQRQLFAQVEKLGESKIESFAAAVEDGQLIQWMRSNNIQPKIIATFSWNSKDPREIKRYLCDGFGRPVIPGSSLKGVFRTAILSSLVRAENNVPVQQALSGLLRSQRVNFNFADQAICKDILGRDANMNLMRSLTVADFTFAPDDLKVAPAVVTRLTSANTMQPKHWKIALERLNQGAVAKGQVSFDDFLVAQARGKAGFNFRAELNLPFLLDALRARTDSQLENEQQFLADKSGEYVEELRQFNASRARDFVALEENEAMVQFSWGSGWKGMTGELLEPESLTREVRNKLRLAPQYNQFPFPKSRRLALDDAGPVPLGWLKLTFTEKKEVRRQEAIALKEKREAEQRAEAEKAAEEKARQAFEALSEAERSAHFIRKDGTPENEIVAIYNKLAGFEADDQVIIALALKEYWVKANKWKVKPKKKKQWEKVQKVKGILGKG